MNITMNEMWKLYVFKVFYFFSVNSPTPPFFNRDEFWSLRYLNITININKCNKIVLLFHYGGLFVRAAFVRVLMSGRLLSCSRQIYIYVCKYKKNLEISLFLLPLMFTISHVRRKEKKSTLKTNK